MRTAPQLALFLQKRFPSFRWKFARSRMLWTSSLIHEERVTLVDLPFLAEDIVIHEDGLPVTPEHPAMRERTHQTHAIFKIFVRGVLKIYVQEIVPDCDVEVGAVGKMDGKKNPIHFCLHMLRCPGDAMARNACVEQVNVLHAIKIVHAVVVDFQNTGTNLDSRSRNDGPKALDLCADLHLKSLSILILTRLQHNKVALAHEVNDFPGPGHDMGVPPDACVR